MNHLPIKNLSALRATVVLVCDQPEFAPSIIARWQAERQVPSFTLLGSDLGNRPRAAFDMAIVGPVREGSLRRVLEMLGPAAPVICVTQDRPAAENLRSAYGRVLVLHQHEAWVDTVVLLGSEVLRRVHAVAHMHQAEMTASLSQRYATLGRYMLEMRHSFNNAMTSVLGNAELLLLEPAAFSAQVREQIDTIRTMALRMHEIMQRFSSLETEMQFAEPSSQRQQTLPQPIAMNS